MTNKRERAEKNNLQIHSMILVIIAGLGYSNDDIIESVIFGSIGLFGIYAAKERKNILLWIHSGLILVLIMVGIFATIKEGHNIIVSFSRYFSNNFPGWIVLAIYIYIVCCIEFFYAFGIIFSYKLITSSNEKHSYNLLR